MSIDFSKIITHKTDYLSQEEVEAMLTYCATQKRVRDYLLILTLYHTGRRISEIVGRKPYTKDVGLRPIDIHPDGFIEFGILKKNHIWTKTKTGQKVSETKLIKLRAEKKPKRVLKAVDKDYLLLLVKFIEKCNISDYKRVFPITRQRADQIVKEIAKEANIRRANRKIHCHQFRHSFSIAFLKANPNNPAALIQLMMILEHSSVEVTKGYLQFTQEDIKESLNKMFGDKE